MLTWYAFSSFAALWWTQNPVEIPFWGKCPSNGRYIFVKFLLLCSPRSVSTHWVHPSWAHGYALSGGRPFATGRRTTSWPSCWHWIESSFGSCSSHARSSWHACTTSSTSSSFSRWCNPSSLWRTYESSFLDLPCPWSSTWFPGWHTSLSCQELGQESGTRASQSAAWRESCWLWLFILVLRSYCWRSPRIYYSVRSSFWSSHLSHQWEHADHLRVGASGSES